VKQFILNSEPEKDGSVILQGNDYHYLVRVRRLAAGEIFPALLPGGEETLIQIVSVNGGVLKGKCIESSVNNSVSFTPPGRCEKPSLKIPPIILFQALPKSDKMDLIVRQAAEGGITEIVPFVSDYSVAKINTEGKKISRWERIIKEARQQSGSGISTALRSPMPLNDLFNYWHELKNNGALGIFFHHLVLEQKSLHEYLNNNPCIVVLAVGPEGGFSEREVSLFLENDFKPLTLGDTILRTETAALYCSAAIRVLLLEKDSWEQKRT